MPGSETGGVSNFWYSFDYGLAHFVSMDGETDYANSPEWSFAEDLTGNETHPTESETFVTDSGPFGAVDGSVKDTKSYEQYKWLKNDLSSLCVIDLRWRLKLTRQTFLAIFTLLSIIPVSIFV